MSLAELPDGWESRGGLPALFKRFEFESYNETRAFLDALAALAEETGLHPQNINFASTYVNITLDTNDKGELGEAELGLAMRINQLYLKKSD
ncbi:Pterin-4a-carbinolamine dehydratase [Nitrosomonas sp. Nm51]|uniref:4a-hydroxytetrahydrobiopterin dehydratase n=1 Tax=Nitrosomonas sp. Nm51 TaxID=133720 RepID=UPI0008C94E74|nr:4a-hydroxytetrahydrobiopterin dehydratase [Nitrosomonas sp. Nm51]SEQ88815.1 Pterin-4a-carbinolamine dehydratase [Nitrosomonas sp. Nm51]